ncbi:ABC transporter permease [Flavisolibacter ginsenosidimutans]|uniref:FtsX-like permease family protein n=1 Tax=Flavisolibacter ginsenosidimutans TaxID=661481 RepID=A0A5B8UPD8_9BACT|nr:ABC transporter permease [Flavisolibacter ginsenosidimutans]QEC57900.1 FtsX-like permease family protein [Flavisolibacter ginsenosidimutans]
MFRNYLKIALRNFRKYKAISFINLFGLTVGLTCCLLILAYILNELSYDRFRNAKNIYRVERTFLNPQTKDVNLSLSAIAPPFGSLLRNDFKEIKVLSQLLQNFPTPFRFEEKMFSENNSFFGDGDLLNLFDVHVLRGNPAKALAEPFSVMLTEETAKKYFGNEDPLNKVIRMNNQFDLKVTGIYKAFPSNAHLHPEVLISFPTLMDSAVYGKKNFENNYGNNAFYTYVLLPDNYDPKKLEAQLPAFQNRHIPPDNNGLTKASDYSLLTLRKLTDIHLQSHTDDEVEENGDIKRVYIFSIIALVILLIACINYMNLSTARSVLRGKEIGIRKVVGAGKKELIAQFLSESVLMCWMATLLAFFFTWLTLPFLNKLSGQNLNIAILLNWHTLLPLSLVPFAVGLLSGLYPALFLSSFQPIKVLKGILKPGSGGLSFRKALVVVQFSISIVLIIATAVVFQQLRYMQNKSLGFDKDRIVTLSYNGGLTPKYESFKSEVLSSAAVKSMARSSRIPTGRLLDNMGTQINRGDSLTPTQADIKYVVADEDYLSTYGVKILAGRGFSNAYGMDTSSFLLNEASVKILGFNTPEQAVGKQMVYGGNKGQVVGVFNDFHFESMHQRILPLVMFIPKNSNYYGLTVKLSGDVHKGLAHLENTWKKFLPEVPFEYTFLDDRFAKLYQSEERQKTIFTVFALIAIFVACLGLFGLSAFTISQRVKEIGIRKVLGASVNSIVGLLSKDFLLLIGVSALVAFPVAGWAMYKWLQDFAYRINLQWWVFLLAGMVAAAVAFFTIGLLAVKAANSNPVKNLRTE